jgi:hypothetical protein
MIPAPEGVGFAQRGVVSMTNAQVKHAVMLTVAFAWLIYVLVGIFRNQLPEVWTWGIPSGVYVALYQPWDRRSGAGGVHGRGPYGKVLPGPPGDGDENPS